MSYKLGFDMTADAGNSSDSLLRLKTPNGASGIYGTRANEIRIHLVPVKTRQGGAKVTIFVIVEETLQLDFSLCSSPYSEVITACGQ